MSNDTLAKMYLYKTAYSPVYEAYVGILGVRKDERGELIIDAHVAGTPEADVVAFRVHELTRYCL